MSALYEQVSFKGTCSYSVYVSLCVCLGVSVMLSSYTYKTHELGFHLHLPEQNMKKLMWDTTDDIQMHQMRGRKTNFQTPELYASVLYVSYHCK